MQSADFFKNSGSYLHFTAPNFGTPPGQAIIPKHDWFLVHEYPLGLPFACLLRHSTTLYPLHITSQKPLQENPLNLPVKVHSCMETLFPTHRGMFLSTYNNGWGILRIFHPLLIHCCALYAGDFLYFCSKQAELIILYRCTHKNIGTPVMPASAPLEPRFLSFFSFDLKIRSEQRYGKIGRRPLKKLLRPNKTVLPCWMLHRP